jgi:excisionase family DNA binding protein
VITVIDAARRAGRNPETIRRWIREGRLRAQRVGTRHMIDEADLDAATEEPRSLPMPREWQALPSGRPAPDWVKALDEARGGR